MVIYQLCTAVEGGKHKDRINADAISVKMILNSILRNRSERGDVREDVRLRVSRRFVPIDLIRRAIRRQELFTVNNILRPDTIGSIGHRQKLPTLSSLRDRQEANLLLVRFKEKFIRNLLL